jgi:hypothetical protein
MCTQKEVWRPIDVDQWKHVLVTADRVADIDDIKVGRAVFHLRDPKEIGAEPISMPLPCCAILKEEKSEKPVIIIQAEKAGDKTYIGFRDLVGGNGICTIAELELLQEPDARFYQK